MENKIRIKLGPIEVEYEGSEAFLKEELPDLIKTVSELYKTSNLHLNAGGGGGSGDSGGTGGGSGKIQLSTASIAAKLDAKEGTGLIIAAVAHFTFVKGVSIIPRNQLLDEMKTATGYYKGTMSGNLSRYLTTLIKGGKLTEPSTGSYALSADTRKEIEGRLAG